MIKNQKLSSWQYHVLLTTFILFVLCDNSLITPVFAKGKTPSEDSNDNSPGHRNKTSSAKNKTLSSESSKQEKSMLDKLQEDVHYIQNTMENHRNQIYERLEYHRQHFVYDVTTHKTYMERDVEKMKSQIHEDLETLQTKYETIKSEMYNGAEYLTENIENHLQQIQTDIDTFQEELLKMSYEVQNTVEGQFNQVWSDFSGWKQRTKTQISKTYKHFSRKYKNRFMKSVLSQRVGWDRFNHSVRNHLGLILGAIVAFRGNALPGDWFLQGVPIELAMLSWDMLDGRQRIKYQPWVNDLVALIVGAATIKLWSIERKSESEVRASTPKTKWHHHHLLHAIRLKRLPWKTKETEKASTVPKQPKFRGYSIKGTTLKSLPMIFFTHWLFYFSGIVVDEWDDDEVKIGGRVLWSTVGSLLGLAITIQALEVPIDIAASSVAGSLLICDSWRNEVAGNWFYMLETMASLLFKFRPSIRKVLHALKSIVKKSIAVWKLRTRSLDTPIPDRLRRLCVAIYTKSQQLIQIVMYPYNSTKAYIHEHQVYKRIAKFTARLQKALGPIMWPLGITIWGIVVQMGYITGVGSIWRTLRFSIDPISFCVNKLSRLFNIKVRFRHALLTVFKTSWSRSSKQRHESKPRS